MGSAGGYAMGQLYVQADAYLDSKTSPVNLPTPLPSVEWKADMSEAYIKVQTAAYTGFGNVILVAKKDAEPSSSTDGSAISSGSLTVTENGTYYVRAFPGADSSFLASDSYKIYVNGIVLTHIIGVRRSRSSTSSDWERLTPSTDPIGVVTETISVEPVAEITGTQSGQSVFDNYTPWQKKMRNFEDDGTPGTWYGDSGFTLTGKDVMVYYPDCYIKLVVSSDGYTYRYISDAPTDGFSKAPWSGMYGARYKIGDNGKYISRSFAAIITNKSIVTMRNRAKEKGAGWGLHDFVERCANEWLFIIEYASYNCQEKIGAGVSSLSSKKNTGGTDSMDFHTGRSGGTETGVSVQYRYSEDLWGNTYDWCDGINIINGQTWVSTDWQNYQSDVTAGYTAIGTALSGNTSGYISELVEDEENAWCCGVPKAFYGSDTTYITDYAYCYSGTYVLRVGGYWDDGSRCGLFYFDASITSSYTYSFIGSRLTYRPS